VEDLDTINRELQDYSPALAQRPQIIVANKCDILDPDSDNLIRLRKRAEELGCDLFEISAAAQMGVRDLVMQVWNRLEQLPPVQVFAPEVSVEAEVSTPTEREIHIEVEDGIYYVSGAWVERIVGSINFDDYESRMYFERVLRKAGVFDMLEREGIQEKDTVDVLGLQFEYVF
jgi:GTP-binding protein